VFRALRDRSPRATRCAMTAIFRTDQYSRCRRLRLTWRGDVECRGGCLIEHSSTTSTSSCSASGGHGVTGRHEQFRPPRRRDLATVSLQFRVRGRRRACERLHDILSRGSTAGWSVLPPGMAWLDNDFLGRSSADDAEQSPSFHPRLGARPGAPVTTTSLAISAYVEADRAFLEAVTAGRDPDPELRRGRRGASPRRRLPLIGLPAHTRHRGLTRRRLEDRAPEASGAGPDLDMGAQLLRSSAGKARASSRAGVTEQISLGESRTRGHERVDLAPALDPFGHDRHAKE